jgi:cupin superfamily acireductone dioxygenase involved in methionine salvage
MTLGRALRAHEPLKMRADRDDLAAEQARIEIVIDRWMNANAFEVRMLGI